MLIEKPLRSSVTIRTRSYLNYIHILGKLLERRTYPGIVVPFNFLEPGIVIASTITKLVVCSHSFAFCRSPRRVGATMMPQLSLRFEASQLPDAYLH